MLFHADLVESDNAVLGKIRPDELQTFLRGLVKIKIKIGERDNCLRMAFKIDRQGLGDIPFDKLVLFHVTAHGQLFMRGKDFAQKRLIPRRDAKFADFGGFVLARYGRKSLKGIETYNLT